jgi:ribosomal protein S18 acetylase RimI-like enzyme
MRSEVANPSDAVPLMYLVNAAYRGAGGQRGWTHEAELLAGDRIRTSDVVAMLGDAHTTVLTRRSGEPPAILGCIAIEMTCTQRCTIFMLAVAPKHQAAGLGRALLADAEDFAANGGARIARISVIRQRESLIAWYERRGYRRTGALEVFPYDGSVGTPLRDDIELVVLEKALRESTLSSSTA